MYKYSVNCQSKMKPDENEVKWHTQHKTNGGRQISFINARNENKPQVTLKQFSCSSQIFFHNVNFEMIVCTPIYTSDHIYQK